MRDILAMHASIMNKISHYASHSGRERMESGVELYEGVDTLSGTYPISTKPLHNSGDRPPASDRFARAEQWVKTRGYPPFDTASIKLMLDAEGRGRV